MDKFKMELTWHNCKMCPPEEDSNPFLIITDGKNIEHCAYYKKYGFPPFFDDKCWWADIGRTVRESKEFKDLVK